MIVQILAYDLLGSTFITVSEASPETGTGGQLEFWRKAQIPAGLGTNVAEAVAAVAEALLDLAYDR